jgi:hypothetical protein
VLRRPLLCCEPEKRMPSPYADVMEMGLTCLHVPGSCPLLLSPHVTIWQFHLGAGRTTLL